MNGDGALLKALRTMWEQIDPCSADLAERSLFRLALENLDAEMMTLQGALSPSGARGPETVSTIIFESEKLSLVITVSAVDRGRRRVDGWITPSAALLVRLHLADGTREEAADADGRFAFVEVPVGMAYFTIEPTPQATLPLTRTIITPAINI